ncbi:MAG: hypothetical protein U0414_36320 [Polyangiaceae bacterium]
MPDDRRARVSALLSESLDLYAAVTAVCRAEPEEKAFAVAALNLDLAAFDPIDAKWRQRLARDPALELMFETLAREYEWAFRHLRAGAIPAVET